MGKCKINARVNTNEHLGRIYLKNPPQVSLAWRQMFFKHYKTNEITSSGLCRSPLLMNVK